MDAAERQIEAQERQRTLAREQRITDLREIAGLPAGRRFLWDLFEHGRVFGSSFSATASGLEMAYLEGRRAFSTELLQTLMDAAPDRFQQMRREYARMRESQKQKIREAMDDDSDHTAG